MRHITTLFFLLSFNFSNFGQTNPLLNQWEKVYQHSRPLSNMTKNGSILYTFDVNNQNYYESKDTGKTWTVKIVKGDSPFFQYEDFILANGGRTIQVGSGTQSTISESWVSASKGNLSFRSLGFTGSDCGWHSGTCKSWGGYKICDTIATYNYYEGGYRVTDPYIDRYYINSTGNELRYVPNFYKRTAFTSQYNIIGFHGSRAIGTTGNSIVVEYDTVFHAMPIPDIANLKIAFWGNKCFVFKTNGVIWSSTNWGNWTAQNIPLSNVSEIEHTHGFFLAKTDKGYFKATPADSLVWSPLYQNGISGSDSLTKITVFNNLLIGYANDKIYRSFNGGATWDFVVPQGIENQANSVQIGLERDSVQINFDNLSLRIDSLGSLLKRKMTTYFVSSSIPDTVRKGVFIAINNDTNFSFSKDSGQTWESTSMPIFKKIFLFKDKLYGVSLSGIWRIKLQNLNCFSSETTTLATLDCFIPYNFEGQSLTKAGDYTKIYATANGCDIIIHLHLSAPSNNWLSDYKTVKICKNIPYYFGDNRILSSGNYRRNDTLPSGCIIFRYLNIELIDRFLFFKEITVNEGDTVRNVRMSARDTIFETKYQAVGGCDSIYQLYVHVRPSTTAALEIKNDELILYPNPTKSSFDIKTNLVFDKTSSITIFDSKGGVVYQTQFDFTSKTVDTEGWQRGVYFVKITTRQGVFVKKLILH
jgi:hypothetical protein